MVLQSYFQLIGPLIFTGFSLGFYLVYRYARELVSAKMLALAYTFGNLGFLVEIFFTGTMTALVVPFYLLCATFGAAALFKMYKRPVPWVMLCTIAAFATLNDLYHMFVNFSYVVRVLNGNFAVAFIFSVPVIMLWKRSRDTLGTITLALVGATVVQYFVRPVITLWLEPVPLTIANYPTSLTTLSQQLVTSVGAVVLAIVLFIRFGMALVERLSVVAETDPLTGLANRRGMEKHISKMTDKQNAVIIIDLDHFKSVNDDYGHDAGDAVLRATSDLLKQIEDEFVFSARLGGEEFVVLLEDVSLESAVLIGQAICKSFSIIEHDALDGKTVTMSLGIAQWTNSASFSRALRYADKALYHAKQTGRNKVCKYAGPKFGYEKAA